MMFGVNNTVAAANDDTNFFLPLGYYGEAQKAIIALNF